MEKGVRLASHRNEVLRVLQGLHEGRWRGEALRSEVLERRGEMDGDLELGVDGDPEASDGLHRSGDSD